MNVDRYFIVGNIKVLVSELVSYKIVLATWQVHENDFMH